jgi:hypothetical protein
MVHALEKKHPGRFEITDRPAKDHKSELDKLGIESHGVVCMSGDKVLWKHGDHKMSQAQLDAGLAVVLEATR